MERPDYIFNYPTGVKDEGLTLRRGTAKDLSLIYRLERQYIEELESDQLTAWERGMKGHIEQWAEAIPRTIIAQSRSMAVGYLFWEQQGTKAVVASVSVDPEHRRRGIASTLMSGFESEARHSGCANAELGFVSHNPARHLYQALGYTLRGVDGRYILMVKHL